MKRIVSGEELQNKMLEAIELLCGTVKQTLGPYGRNVIIDHSNFSPFITNDGATIAMNIESDDEVVNTIITMAKEASLKTNDRVGDGTTTTLVLLEAILKCGVVELKRGVSSIVLKRELEKARDFVKEELSKLVLECENDVYYNIAKISGGCEEIAKNISDAYIKTGNKNAIHITESNLLSTKIENINGYTFDTIVPSIYFFQKSKRIEFECANVVIINNFLNDIEEVSQILNSSIENKDPLIIVADDYSDEFTNDVLALFLKNNLDICLLKAPNYGLKKKNVLQDLAAIINAEIVDNYFNCNNLGFAKKIIIAQDKTTIIFDTNDKVKERISFIEKELLYEDDDLEKEFLEQEISMLREGLINVIVGATTDVERRELRMRYDDALSAVSNTKNGVVLGGGITYLNVSSKMDCTTIGDNIIKEALKVPFYQILQNSGVNIEEIEEEIKKARYQKVYNVKKFSYEEIDKITVLDPLDVVLNSFINAVSISSMLLTTSSIVINECLNNISKVNEYTEL